MQAVDQRSPVGGRLAFARRIFRHRTIRFGLLEFALLLPVRAAFIGLLLAAFLPMHLYLAQYVTNEMLAATLATAAFYLCLRLLKSEVPRPSQFAWLGVALGATIWQR
jgi:Predicted membrane protein